MDNTYFNVKIEFDKEKLDNIIFNAIENGVVGYSCSVEAKIGRASCRERV